LIIRSLLIRHRRFLSGVCVGLAIASPLVLSAVALTRFISDPDAQQFLMSYMAPLFIAAPLWVRLRLGNIHGQASAAIAVDAIVLAAGSLRVFGGWGVFPYSGHMLFLTYALLVTPVLWFRSISLGLLVMTSYFKLALWHDARSWGLGLVLGLGLAFAQWLANRFPRRPTQPSSGAHQTN
jgi:hypothetical protein